MIGRDHTWYYFNRNSILTNAPATSGVYAIFRFGTWIYVGETGDIQARLLEHLNGDNPCITQSNPDGFQFELVAANQRVARQDAWIPALNPACNQRLG